MKEIIQFLRDLQSNNNREWFNSHKDQYKKIESKFYKITEELICGISTFDGSVKNLTVSDCTYRIYRDTRFSKDKTPYKPYMGAYICQGGKKSGNAGYYFHIEPVDPQFLSGSLLSAGLYMPEKNALQSVREDIAYQGDLFVKAIKKAKHFSLVTSNSLKKVPPGFDKDNCYSNYLKLKDIYLLKELDANFLLSSDLISNTVDLFRETYDIVGFINRAIKFIREEE